MKILINLTYNGKIYKAGQEVSKEEALELQKNFNSPYGKLFDKEIKEEVKETKEVKEETKKEVKEEVPTAEVEALETVQTITEKDTLIKTPTKKKRK